MINSRIVSSSASSTHPSSVVDDADAVKAATVTTPPKSNGLASNVANNPRSIESLTSQIRDLEQNGESFDGQLDGLRSQRDDLIKAFTGNSSADSYDVDVVGWAQSRGTTYNHEAIQLNTSRTFQNIHRPANDQIPLVPVVRELPWESVAVNQKVDSLIMTDGLSVDAARVIAMTERPNQSVLSNVIESIREGMPGSTQTQAADNPWESEFARMVTGSSDEITAWALNQDPANTVVFDNSDNQIRVSMDNGMVVVSDGTTTSRFDPSVSERIVINGGGGNDNILVDENVIANLVLAGGDGVDNIVGGNGNNIILGGRGNDNIEGGRQADLILGGADADVVYAGGGKDVVAGGTGRDSIYGGQGRDVLVGGSGDDYLDGGRSRDALFGGVGDDVLSGGKGGDALDGQVGSDTLIGASGNDRFNNVEAGDTVIAESFEALIPSTATVRIVDFDADAGNDAISIDPASRRIFRDRVSDDIETLRSLRAGQEMLNGLDSFAVSRGNTVSLEELQIVENGFARFEGTNRFFNADGTPSEGGDTTIRFNPSVNLTLNTSGETPPIVILFHEFAHAYHNSSGTTIAGTYAPAAGNADPNNGTNNRELQASGIEVDHDGDPRTPNRTFPSHPFRLTENGLREELNLEARTVY